MEIKKRNTYEILAVVGLWLTILQPYDLSAQGDPLIEPGSGVGVLKLGMTIEQIRERVLPNKPSNEGPTKTSGEYVQIYGDLGMKFYFKEGSLERIVIINPKLMVKDSRIHVGDSVSRIRSGRSELERLGIYYHISINKKTIVAIEIRRPAK